MPTYPLTTLAPVITTAGISAPVYADILASLQASFRQIYGDDAYLDADSQDGQLLAIIAQAIHDSNQAAIAVYNSFSPQTAFGAGLSNVVKINHIKRLVATNSQVNVTVGGQAGTLINAGVVGDTAGQLWNLPTTVTIPPAGAVIVTATAQELGALTAPIGTVTKIVTPTAGWQTVTNASAASPGQPVETDAELRARQVISPALNSNTVLTGLAAAIKVLPGVTYGTIYENDTGTTNADGLPPHSIALVVQGGVAADIAQTLYNRKAPGVATYGTTTINITDVSGAVRAINYYVPTEKPIKVGISLYAGTNYTTTIATAIKQAVADFINGLDIGEDLINLRLMVPAMLNGAQNSETYRVSVVQSALYPSGTLGSADTAIAFNEKATCLPAQVTITLL